MTTFFHRADIQGNILRGYRANLVRHLVLEVRDRTAVRQFLRVAAEEGSPDVPAITRESSFPDGKRPAVCFNIGITHAGLRALGVAWNHLASFPTEFIEGMAARAMKLGDFGESAPQNWPAPFDDPDRVHVIASVYADRQDLIDGVTAQVGRAFHVLGHCDGRTLAGNKVLFGYADGISQPVVSNNSSDEATSAATQSKPTEGDTIAYDAVQQRDKLGTLFLGHQTRYQDMMFGVPQPEALGLNGSFNAFRVLKQKSWAFDQFLDRSVEEVIATPFGAALLQAFGMGPTAPEPNRRAELREIIAAQLCGRWFNGNPYDQPREAHPDRLGAKFTDYNYGEHSRCPVGAHMRRTNPRGSAIVQRIASHTRRIVRRGMVYGPDYDPAAPNEAERGLLGNFIGASLGAQFEAIMCDWLNLGLQHPDLTGSNDPLVGANSVESSWFDLVLPDGKTTYRLRNFDRFVITRGGAYTFLPSMKAIRHLAGMTN